MVVARVFGHTGELLRALQYSTILSQQNKGVIGTFKLHNIYKRFTITVISDLKKRFRN